MNDESQQHFERLALTAGYPPILFRILKNAGRLGLAAFAGLFVMGLLCLYINPSREPLDVIQSANGFFCLYGSLMLALAITVVPFDARMRTARLNLPVPDSQLLRTNLRYLVRIEFVSALAMAIVFAFAFAAGNGLVDAGIRCASQLLILFAFWKLKHFAMCNRGKGGKYRGVLTFLLATGLLPIILPLVVLWRIAFDDPSEDLLLSAFALCSLLVLAWRKQLLGFSPSRRTLRRMLTTHRTLPDRESPAIGHLTFPKLPTKTNPAPEESSNLLTLTALYAADNFPTPSSLVPHNSWMFYRIFAACLAVVFSFILVAGEIAHVMVAPSLSRPFVFVLAMIPVHVPPMIGTMIAAFRVNRTILTKQDLARMACWNWRGDSLASLLLVLPAAGVYVLFTGDVAGIAIQITGALLAALLFRYCAFRFPTDRATLPVSALTLLLSFLLVAIWREAGLVNRSVFALAPLLTICVLVFRWDRIAAVLQRVLPKRVSRVVGWMLQH